ncbi:DUF1068 domain-containing protein [Quillaja saponaria]|uniref:DUF1068 domain-containing protein n=1 Tax=Quillaja saponaria TaxID=32244 RepID=A0AAD7QAP2_QUISA|nr:DUF1068 domain-containing protein [Quillaja saponaria]
MAHSHLPKHGVLRLFLVLVGVCLVEYTVGPTLFLCWRLKGVSSSSSSTIQDSCTPCDCFCSSEDTVPQLSDCGRNDPDMKKEMKKDRLTVLSEEIALHDIVVRDTMEHTKGLIMDTRKSSYLYQKEAEKCNVGIKTCEEARERAEAELIEERKITTLWENRARQQGWEVDQ